MNRPYLATGILLASLLIPTAAQSATFTQIVSFGDSLSDLGRASTATFGQVPPYSQGNGRFSNGAIWLEYLAGIVGLPVNPATNFAIGGATTGTVNTIKPILPPNLPTINAFNGLEDQINSFISDPNPADPNALYTIWAGANDYVGEGQTNPAIPVGRLVTDVRLLAQKGAKNILIANLPNLGELPVTNNTPNSAPLNLLTQANNGGLSQGLNGLRPSLPSDVKLTLLDINSLFNSVQANPGNYGFLDATNGCLLIACTNPNQFLFWDTLHPTTQGHQIIGQFAAQALGIPEGSMVFGLLTIGFLGLGGLTRKRQSNS